MAKETFIQGRISGLVPERGYGFITGDSAEYHFYFNPERPDHAFCAIGAMVEFVVVDRSTQRKTNPRALDKAKWIRPARASQKRAA